MGCRASFKQKELELYKIKQIIKTKMKTQQDIQQSQQSEECIFCPQAQNSQPSNLFTMMNHALISKHLSQSNSHLIQPIDVLLKLQDANTTAELQEYIMYKQYIFVDNVEQNMKRQYKISQFSGKISMLSEYYKFHKDIPHIVERNIQKILSKYYDRRRQFDYKIIKKKLKEEQGLSITSVEETITENSQTIQQKSRYSTLLNALGQSQSSFNHQGEFLMSDSNLLQQICRQIGRALPKIKILQTDFKGSFYENNNERNFDKYVKKQQMKKLEKKMNQMKVQEKLKRKTKNIDLYNSKENQRQQISNYFNFQKKAPNFQTIQDNNQFHVQGNNVNETIKNNRNNNMVTKNKRSDESRKKFVYNTNIKIEIQNALFYPNQHHPQFASAATTTGINGRNINVYSGENIRSRKSLVGKISTINEDRYRTPVSKIYQPHETEISTRYGKKNRSIKKEKERLKTKESKEFKDNHYQKQRQISVPRRVMSSHFIKRVIIQPNKESAIQYNKQGDHLKQKIFRNGTISVAKLKLQHQKNDLRNRGNSVKKGGSSQNLRRRSITLTQNKNSLQKIIPITKYSSSEIKDAKFKGITMKQLLSRKLNI